MSDSGRGGTWSVVKVFWSSQKLSARLPAVRSIAWLGLFSRPLEHSIPKIARRFPLRKRSGEEILEHTPFASTERLRQNLKCADTRELYHENVRAGAEVLEVGPVERVEGAKGELNGEFAVAELKPRRYEHKPHDDGHDAKRN